MDAFRDDYIMVRFFPDLYGEKATMPEPQQVATKNKLGKIFGEEIFLDVLSGKSVLFNLEQDGEVVGTALYDLPINERPQLSIVQRLRYWSAWAYFSLKGLLHRSFYKKYFGKPEFLAFHKGMYSAGLKSPQQHADYRTTLASKSPQELATTLYPRDDTLYLHVLALKQSAIGKGYGATLLTKSLAEFNITEGPTFKKGFSVVQGPAKASLFPSRGKESFYQKYGFSTVLEHPSDDAAHPYQVMEKVLS